MRAMERHLQKISQLSLVVLLLAIPVADADTLAQELGSLFSSDVNVAYEYAVEEDLIDGSVSREHRDLERSVEQMEEYIADQRLRRLTIVNPGYRSTRQSRHRAGRFFEEYRGTDYLVPVNGTQRYSRSDLEEMGVHELDVFLYEAHQKRVIDLQQAINSTDQEAIRHILREQREEAWEDMEESLERVRSHLEKVRKYDLRLARKFQEYDHTQWNGNSGVSSQLRGSYRAASASEREDGEYGPVRPTWGVPAGRDENGDFELNQDGRPSVLSRAVPMMPGAATGPRRHDQLSRVREDALRDARRRSIRSLVSALNRAVATEEGRDLLAEMAEGSLSPTASGALASILGGRGVPSVPTPATQASAEPEQLEILLEGLEEELAACREQLDHESNPFYIRLEVGEDRRSSQRVRDLDLFDEILQILEGQGEGSSAPSEASPAASAQPAGGQGQARRPRVWL